MLAFGYAGKARVVDAVIGFVLGLAGWFYILFAIFADEAGNEPASVSVNSHFHASVGTMRLIAMDGWILSWASLPAWLSGFTSCLR